MNEVGSLFATRALPRHRGLLAASALAAGLLLLPGCTTTAPGTDTSAVATTSAAAAAPAAADPTRVVRRLLERSSSNAFTRLSATDGFWASPVARINMPVLFGRTAKGMPGVLKQPAFREKLLRRLNTIAEQGARAAAPQVDGAVRSLTIDNAAGVVAGEPTSATTLLRAQMGPTVVNAMIPELERQLRMTDDPIVGQAVAALKGVKLEDVAHALALSADSAIWYEIGAEEAAIRRDPAKTGDALLIRALSK